jgi:hypothetical protein
VPVPIEPLADLRLDRTLLHVFVAGPGYGEGIAIALPETGWLLVDGCQVERAAPLLRIFTRWRTADDRVDGLILTHPHKDHAMGFRRVLEETAPSRVALTAPPADPELPFRLLPQPADEATSEAVPRRVVQDALAAVQRYVRARPGALLAMSAGVAIPVQSSAVTVTTRSPPEATVSAAFAAALVGGALDPNELSAIIELVFGATRIVLGSDLLASGWDIALAAQPALAMHAGLKIPHHGSSTAHHEGLMTPGEGRAWIVSPFSPCQLPPVHEEGIPWLVERNRTLYVTAAPLARYRQPLPPPTVPLAALAALFTAGAPPGEHAGAISPPLGLRDLDAVWAAAFAADGTVRGLWRGPRAFAVTDR